MKVKTNTRLAAHCGQLSSGLTIYNQSRKYERQNSKKGATQ